MYWFRGQSWHKHSLRYGCWFFFSRAQWKRKRMNVWWISCERARAILIERNKKLHQQQKLLGINGVLLCVQCDTIHTHTLPHTRVQMHVYWAKMVTCSIGSRTARFGFIISIHFDNFYGIRECLDIVSLYHIFMWVCACLYSLHVSHVFRCFESVVVIMFHGNKRFVTFCDRNKVQWFGLISFCQLRDEHKAHFVCHIRFNEFKHSKRVRAIAFISLYASTFIHCYCYVCSVFAH